MPRYTTRDQITRRRWSDLDQAREDAKWARLLDEVHAAATACLHEDGALVSQGAKQETPRTGIPRVSTAPHRSALDGRAASAQYSTRR